MWRRLALAFVLALPATVRGQEADAEPPLAGRPRDFSYIVGRYRITVQAEPTEVFVEEPILLRVRITGQGPVKYQPQLRHLQLFPEELTEQFLVEPVPEKDQVFPRENTWEFVYRLRPRHVQVEAIPALRLVYYLVSPNRRGYQTTYADPIAVVVKPKPPVQPENLGLKIVQAPQRLYELATGPAVLEREEIHSWWTPGVLAALFLGPPALALAWLVVWRRVFPNGVRQLQERRSTAARLALRILQRTGPALDARDVLTLYVRQRLDFPGAEPTPTEIGQFLRRRGVSASVQHEWTDFFAEADAARFDPSSSKRGDRKPLAVRLIQNLEAEPCLARGR